MNKTNKVNNVPKLAIKFANTILILGILATILITIYAIHKLWIYYLYDYLYYDIFLDLPRLSKVGCYNLAGSWVYDNCLNVGKSSIFYYVYIISSVILAILFILGFKLKDEIKVNISLLLVVSIFSIYAFEFYLEFKSKIKTVEFHSVTGVRVDTRTPIELLKDLNNEVDLKRTDFSVYPMTIPFNFLESNGLKTNNGRIFPLGGISNSTSIIGNELGYYPIIKIDEHGFHNSKGLYKKNKVDIILTGDSFTEGYSVETNQNIAGVLRELGFNTISLGKARNAALIEFAALKEYAVPLKPKIVMWLYYLNDIPDINNEIKSPILKKYLIEDDFSQNLILKQDEIDNALKKYHLKRWEEKIKEKRNFTFFKIIKIFNIRKKINLIPNLVALQPNQVSEIDSSIDKKNDEIIEKIKKEINYKKISDSYLKSLLHTANEVGTENTNALINYFKIMQKSKKMISEWDGKMYIVYLPPHYFYTGLENLDLYRKFLFNTANELNIPIIDLHKELFEPHHDTWSLYANRENGGHYSVKGYRLLANTINKKIKEDGFISKPNLNN